MRKPLVTTLALAICLALALPALAQMMGPGMGWQGGQQGYDPAQAQALYDLQNEYYGKMLPIQGKLQSQYAELYGQMYAKEPAQAAVKKSVAAIADLQGQLLQLSVEYAQKVYAKTGYPMGLMGMGMGMGMMGGYGMMGPGMMGPGYGYGMMGPGMMGPGYGYGMMGPGYGRQ